jgi:hypothetical protein
MTSRELTIIPHVIILHFFDTKSDVHERFNMLSLILIDVMYNVLSILVANVVLFYYFLRTKSLRMLKGFVFNDPYDTICQTVYVFFLKFLDQADSSRICV